MSKRHRNRKKTSSPRPPAETSPPEEGKTTSGKPEEASQPRPPEPPSSMLVEAEGVSEAAQALAKPTGGGSRLIPRVVSLIMLLAVVLLVTAMFFRVMLQFIAPLFLAAVLVVIFEPLHKRVIQQLPGRPRWAALVTTILVAFGVLAPTTWLGLNAIAELAHVTENLDEEAREKITATVKQRGTEYIQWYERTTKQNFDEQVRKVGGQAVETVASLGISSLMAVLGFLVGLAIMTIALYYFFADGPAMVDALMKLSPLDDDYELQLLEKFAEVSRAVVVATLLSAAAQGIMAGAGYYFALDGGPIFLLTALTMLMAIVPFVGATAVWIPVVAWVYFIQGDTTAAIVLGLWCAVAVSNIDNVIKPLVLHGQSKIHPLLALLSVLGGISVLGPVGILVGPMLVAFLQALLSMLRKELEDLKGDAPPMAGAKV